MQLIDTHAHIDMPEFDEGRAEAIKRANTAGVSKIINIGIDAPSSIASIKLSEEYSGVYAAIGIHPNSASDVTEKDWAVIENLASNKRVKAIGETGLDYYRDYAKKEDQQMLFIKHLELAEKHNLPVVIHCRSAEEDTLSILAEWVRNNPSDKERGVLHCFNGSYQLAKRYTDMGFLIALGAYITYPSAKNLAPLIKEIPLDKLMVETDCPFLPPQSERGNRNEPSYIPQTIAKIASVKEISSELIAEKTTSNALRLFNL